MHVVIRHVAQEDIDAEAWHTYSPTLLMELRAGVDTMDVAMETERIVGTAAYMPHEYVLYPYSTRTRTRTLLVM